MKRSRVSGRARPDEPLADWCEAQIDSVCTGQAEHRHHVRRRSQGGKDDASNTRDLCGRCHDWVHAHPAEAYSRGLLAKSGPSEHAGRALGPDRQQVIGHDLRQTWPVPSGWKALCECGEQFHGVLERAVLDRWHAHWDEERENTIGPLCRTCDMQPATYRATDPGNGKSGSWPICDRCIVHAANQGMTLTVMPLRTDNKEAH